MILRAHNEMARYRVAFVRQTYLYIFKSISLVITIFAAIMPAKQRRKLIYNFSSLGLIQVTNFLLSLLVIPFVIRRVGADGFGVIAVAQVVVFYLSVLTDYGFNQTATKDIALYKNDKLKVSRIFFTVLAAKTLICILTFGLLIIFLLAVPVFYEHFNLYILAFAFVLGQTLLISWFFQGIEKMQYMAITALLSRLIFVTLVFVFIRSRGDESLFLFFMGIGNMVGALVGIGIAFRIFKLKFAKPSWTDIKHEFKEGWQITVTNLSMTTCQYIGVFILRIFTNDLVVGYYSIAEKIYFAMKIMTGTFSQVIYPQVCQLVHAGRKQLILFFRQNYLPFLAVVIAGSAIVFIFSDQVLYFFIGYRHQQSSFILRIMCVAAVIVCMNMPAYLVLLAANHKKSYLKIFTAGTVLNITANIVLVQFLNAAGTVLSVIITELFITAGLWWEVYRLYSHAKNEGDNFLKSLFYESK